MPSLEMTDKMDANNKSQAYTVWDGKVGLPLSDMLRDGWPSLDPRSLQAQREQLSQRLARVVRWQSQAVSLAARRCALHAAAAARVRSLLVTGDKQVQVSEGSMQAKRP